MNSYFAEYVWLDSENNFRSKTKIITNELKDRFNLTNYPHWNYDGSSTGQATLNDSEVQFKTLFCLS